MSRPSNLFTLQKIDSQIDQHQKRLLEIEETLADNLAIRKAEARAHKANALLEKGQKELRSAETKVKDQRVKIQQNESTLYSGKIRNPKELQDLQEEVASLKRFLETLEERQLEAMLHVDEVKDNYEKASKKLAVTRKKTEALHGDLLAEKSTIENRIRKLEKERIPCSANIQTEDIAVYNRLRQQRSGIAVAKVNDQACSACGATLTAALHQMARSPSQITHCVTCGRILYAT